MANRFSTVQRTVQYRWIFVLLFGQYSLQLDNIPYLIFFFTLKWWLAWLAPRLAWLAWLALWLAWLAGSHISNTHSARTFFSAIAPNQNATSGRLTHNESTVWGRLLQLVCFPMGSSALGVHFRLKISPPRKLYGPGPWFSKDGIQYRHLNLSCSLSSVKNGYRSLVLINHSYGGTLKKKNLANMWS